MASESEKKKYHAKNTARLKKLGLSDSDITSYRNIYNNHINDDEYDRIAKDWGNRQKAEQAKIAALDARTPDFLKNDPSYQALNADMREIAIYNYEVQQTNDRQKAEALGKALELATQQAEPYWKSILLVAQDEILRGFEAAEGDYESSVARQQRIMDNISEDLSSNREFLSLEQQQSLTDLSRNYQVNQERLIEGAANAGLTFSTKRRIAERRLGEENTGMVESTTRSYNKQITDLQTAASRGTEEAQTEIEDLQRRLGQHTTSLGRAGESYLGSENLPDLPGYQPLGGVAGGMYEEKVKDVEQRKQALYGELTQASLQY